jgi:hypothetical protein
MQVAAQNRLIDPLLASTEDPPMPRAIRIVHRMPVLQKMLAYAVGVGVRPEHVRSPGAGA